MDDRRRFIRFEVMLKAFYNMRGSFYSKKPCVIKDVSREGIRISTEEPLKKGQSFEFDIEIPGEETKVIAIGETLWSRQFQRETYHSGLAMRTIRRPDRNRILEYASDEWINSQRGRSSILRKTA